MLPGAIRIPWSSASPNSRGAGKAFGQLQPQTQATARQAHARADGEVARHQPGHGLALLLELRLQPLQAALVRG